MDWQKKYEHWKNFINLDMDLNMELERLVNSSQQLEDSFYKSLEFGTGGIRGVIGPGTNRINIYTIRKATEGLALYIEKNGEVAKKRGVVIAYDSRLKSPEFAMEAAKVLGNHGIHTYLFKSLRSTPELSFAVRHLNAFSGIVITASHNPPEYNGFKVYGKDGAQITPDIAKEIIEKVNEIDDELTVFVKEEEKLKVEGLLKVIGEEVDKAYLKQLQTIIVNPHTIDQIGKEFKIVYTPLHGTGNIPVRRALEAVGFKHVQIVKEQEMPDSNFSTVTSPNPEEHAAFELAIQYGGKYEADILLGTDPDTDRVGVAAKNKQGKYEVLTGNQVGALLLHYLITEKKKLNHLPENATVLKTIVTSEIGRAIAASHGIDTIDTLTGFKFIGEKIQEFDETGEQRFLFGYEESYGYLIGDFVRDKDAIQGCLLIAEVGAHYKSLNKTLFDGLLSLFENYGYYKESLESLTLKGKEGNGEINTIMASFRNNPPIKLAGKQLMVIEDYQTSSRALLMNQTEEKINLPKSNVLKYKLEDGTWFCLRPSGTEPKIKFYFGVKEKTLEESNRMLNELKNEVMTRVNQMIMI